MRGGCCVCVCLKLMWLLLTSNIHHVTLHALKNDTLCTELSNELVDYKPICFHSDSEK